MCAVSKSRTKITSESQTIFKKNMLGVMQGNQLRPNLFQIFTFMIFLSIQNTKLSQVYWKHILCTA